MNKVEEDGFMNPDRVSTLIDGIFAIAMTLLILSLEVPHISGQLSDALILSYLYNIVSPFTSFVLSFILLAMFWTINHSQMHYIKRVDKTYLWISIILLLFIVIVPFSTEISGMYGSYTIPQLIFNLNLLGVAILLYLSIYYSDKKMLIEDMNEDKKKTIKNSCAFFIIVALVAVGLSFIAPSWCTIVYMAIILKKLL